MRIWIIVICVVGTLGLMAGLHHIVVLTARGTAFANAFAGTCALCHGPGPVSHDQTSRSDRVNLSQFQ